MKRMKKDFKIIDNEIIIIGERDTLVRMKIKDFEDIVLKPYLLQTYLNDNFKLCKCKVKKC